MGVAGRIKVGILVTITVVVVVMPKAHDLQSLIWQCQSPFLLLSKVSPVSGKDIDDQRCR